MILKFLKEVPTDKNMLLFPCGNSYLEDKILKKLRDTKGYEVQRFTKKKDKSTDILFKDLKRFTIKLPNDKPAIVWGYVKDMQDFKQLQSIVEKQKMTNIWVIKTKNQDIAESLKRSKVWKKLETTEFSPRDLRRKKIIKELFAIKKKQASDDVIYQLIQKFSGDMIRIEIEVGLLCDGINRSNIETDILELIYGKDVKGDGLISTLNKLSKEDFPRLVSWVKNSSITKKWTTGYQILKIVDIAILLKQDQKEAAELQYEQLIGEWMEKELSERLTKMKMSDLRNFRINLLEACAI